MNLIGEGRVKNGTDYTLSFSHLSGKATPEELQALQNNIWNFFINVVKAKTDQVIISTFKGLFEKWTGKGNRLHRYKNNYVDVNSRATNEYKDKTEIAYVAIVSKILGYLVFLES
jgi:hypothetical protein